MRNGPPKSSAALTIWKADANRVSGRRCHGTRSQDRGPVKPYRFHRQADAEFIAAIEYYTSKSPALGQRFYLAIHDLIADVRTSPRAISNDPAALSSALPNALSARADLRGSSGRDFHHRLVAVQTRPRPLAQSAGMIHTEPSRQIKARIEESKLWKTKTRSSSNKAPRIEMFIT